MDIEDLEPRKAQPRNLETMSIGELQAYIGEMETEIARARATIHAKENVRSGAELLFRK